MPATAAKRLAEDLPEEFQTEENFANLFESSFKEDALMEGNVIQGTITAIEKDMALIDVGLKSEGRVPLREFGRQAEELKVGDKVEVFLERIENRSGEASLSREKALREESWTNLEKACEQAQQVEGVIFGRVKGGFTVDLNGAVAFLPGSQVDIRPIRDVTPLMNIPQPFQILKMDRRRGNIVVSRRAILEESRSESRSELLKNIHEGQVLEGMVKNITDYGAFIDLGGIDGLLHVTDISWKRVNHPSEVLHVGQTVEVMVTKFEQETKRVSLGMKQLENNPWKNIKERFKVGEVYTGKITNITDYGAFVELEEGIEGLVHVSEMSWTKKNTHPSKIVSTSQEVQVMVLEVDTDKNRISLGMKQTENNPWSNFANQYPEGATVEGEVRNITEFGLFVGLPGEIDGLVHHSDISWNESGEEAIKAFNKGDKITAKVLIVDPEKERVSLGIKQLDETKTAAQTGSLNKGATVTCEVTAVEDGGIEVRVNDSVKAFIKRSDLARERQEQRPDRFAVGDRVDAKVTAIDAKTHKVSVSIKALEMDEHKKAISEYGNADSGASLGDILGAALSEADSGKKKAAKK